jgi:excisionase family DNA binding protein
MDTQSTGLPCEGRTQDAGNNVVGAVHSVPALKPLTVTVRVARQITGLGNTTIYQLIADGVLESTKVRNKRLINFQSLERLTAPSRSGESLKNPAERATAARMAKSTRTTARNQA